MNKLRDVPPFRDIKKLIKNQTVQFQSNIRFLVFFPWVVYKYCLQEVQALWLFCKHVMSQVTWSIVHLYNSNSLMILQSSTGPYIYTSTLVLKY